MPIVIKEEEANQVKELVPGDKLFKFAINMIQWPRAAIQINANCPENYKEIIHTCQKKGWISPIAYVPVKELVWDVLKK